MAWHGMSCHAIIVIALLCPNTKPLSAVLAPPPAKPLPVETDRAGIRTPCPALSCLQSGICCHQRSQASSPTCRPFSPRGQASTGRLPPLPIRGPFLGPKSMAIGEERGGHPCSASAAAVLFQQVAGVAGQRARRELAGGGASGKERVACCMGG